MSALVLTFCMSPLQSATLERLSLDDMIAKSTVIVRGKVTSAYAAASGPIIYTNYTVQVSERLKGQAGSSVEVSVPGGAANGLRQTFSGAPTLNAGEEFVFFLFTGRDGRTAIIGLTQGLFALPGLLTGPLLSTGLGTRIGVAVAVLAPLGLCLGMFMPLGLGRVVNLSPYGEEYVAWAWAV